ncbi:hypothetical protein RCL1_001377 [Eukaryota sp. TZLM3-RCL]
MLNSLHLFIALCIVSAFAAEITFGSVVFRNGVFEFSSSSSRPSIDEVTAFASWEPSLNETGWHNFHVYTNEKETDQVQMMAAGYLEGRLQYDQIWLHRKNFNEFTIPRYGNIDDPKVVEYFQKSLEFTRNNVRLYSKVDSYWAHVALTMSQFDGFVQGYHDACPPNTEFYLTETQLWLYQGSGDVMEIVKILAPPAHGVDMETMFEHCSALVVLTDDFNNLYTSQVAWFMFGAMNRVLKSYNFHITTTGTAHNRLTFSSYPGFLYSFDDFYVLDGNLAVFETTHHSDNPELDQYMVPESNFEWLRVTVANRMGSDGKTWKQVFERFNSGTYNNMWVVVDYNKFVPGYPPKEGLITVVEQLPGYMFSNDNTTEIVKQGYIPSYNTPSLWATRQMAKTPSSLWSGWDTAGRGQTFRKKAPHVFDLEDMKKLMRYVNPKDHEDFNAFASSSRYDLRKDVNKQIPFGGFDVKIVTQQTISNLWFDAIAGPSDENGVGVFSFAEWDKRHPDKPVPRAGLKDVHDNSWVMFGPVWQCHELTQNACFEHSECGWCGEAKKCIAGNSVRPFEMECATYQYGSKAGVYALLAVVGALCVALITICWCYGCSEKKSFERKLLLDA